MADLSTLANIKPSTYKVTIAGDTAPFEARLRLPMVLETEPVTTMRFGRDAIASMVMGRTFDYDIVFLQATKTELITFLNLAGANPRTLPAVGTQLTTREVIFHNEADGATTTNDIVIYASAFLGVEMESDGEGPQEITVKCRSHRHSGGHVVRVDQATS